MFTNLLSGKQRIDQILHLSSWRYKNRVFNSWFANSKVQLVLAGLIGLALGGYVVTVTSTENQWRPFLLILAIFPFVLMIFRDLRKFLLAVILIELTLIIDINLFYNVELGIQRVSFAGLNISITTIMLAILYGIWFLEWSSKIRAPYTINKLLIVPGILYVAFVGVSVFMARNSTIAAFEFVVQVQSLLLFFYLINNIKTDEDLTYLMKILVICLIIQSTLMLATWVLGRGISLGPVSTQIENSRISGTLGHPNGAASYLSLLLAPALGFFLILPKSWFKSLTLAAVILGMGALILTGSRGGWIAVLVSISLLIIYALWKKWIKITNFIMIILGSSISLILLQSTVVERIFEDDGGSALSRIQLMEIAANMIQDHPLFGVGASNFILSVDQYLTPDFADSYRSVVHNKYLLIWSETGIIALVSFLAFLLLLIFLGWKGSHFENKLSSVITVGFSAAVIGQMIHMNVARFSGRPQIMMFWLVAGIIVSAYSIGQQVQYREPENTVP